MRRVTCYRSKLELAMLDQMLEHVAAGQPDGPVQCVEVQGTGEGVQEAEWQHAGDPATCVLESIRFGSHAVLLGFALAHQVHVTRVVHLRSELAWQRCGLGTLQNGKPVVRKVHTTVALVTRGSSKKDQVLRERRMQNKHLAHGAASIVENPIVLHVLVDPLFAIFLGQLLTHISEQQFSGGFLSHLLVRCNDSVGNHCQSFWVKNTIAWQPSVQKLACP